MLRLKASLLETIHGHARETYPRECCGLLLGRRDSGAWEARGVWPAGNLAAEGVHDRFQLDPADRLRAEGKAKRLGLEIAGFYHSHPDHEAYFSETDLKSSEEYLLGEPWLEPTYAYLVVSIYDREPRAHAAFCIEEGLSRPIAVEVED